MELKEKLKQNNVYKLSCEFELSQYDQSNIIITYYMLYYNYNIYLILFISFVIIIK